MGWQKTMKRQMKRVTGTDIVLVAPPEEIFGHIKVTQVAMVFLASRLNCLEELEKEVTCYTSRAWEYGLHTESGLQKDAVTRDDFPELFEGLKSASENLASLIELRKDLPVGQDFHEECDKLVDYVSQESV